MGKLRIPDDDHVVRYCRPGTRPDGRILISAFELGDEEDCLSVNWLEHHIAGSIDKIRQIFIDKEYTLRPNGRFVELRGSRIHDMAHRAELDVNVLSDPRSNDESHAEVCGPRSTPDEKLLVAGILHACKSDEHLACVP